MPAFPPGAPMKGNRVVAKLARDWAAPIFPVVLELHGQGLSLRKIGRELERRGISPRLNNGNGVWGPAQVSRVLILAQEDEREKEEKKSRITESPALFPAPTVAESSEMLAVKLSRNTPTSPPAPSSALVPKASSPAASPLATPNVLFRLWIGGHAKGPFTEAQVKAELAAGRITLETNCNRIGESTWRPLRKLFGEPIDAAPVPTAKVGYGSVARPGLQNL
jgi:hypothetical protein